MSAIGAILITGVAIIINILTKFINNDKINYKLIICGALCTAYFFVSPIGMYTMGHKQLNYNIEDEHNEHLRELTNEDEISDYILNSLYEFRISEDLIKLYPVKNDPTFWKNIALGNRNLNNDSRVMKTEIIKRIKERNNNKYDNYLGMGYTINFMDLERDYVYQYYLFGLLGIILILPQLFVCFKTGINCLKNIRQIPLLSTVLVAMGPALGFVVAYYSGHVFGWISPSYILVLTIAIFNTKNYYDLNSNNIN